MTGAVDPLERAALEWIAPYRNAAHLVNTREWLLRLAPGARLALRLAALTHDIERHFPGGPAPDPGNPEYSRAHATRSARIVGEWLARRGADAALREEVALLVAAHEEGGWPDADLLQAADSLSYLEVNAAGPACWVRDGRCDVDTARAKLRSMHDRIAVDAAREPAAALIRTAERTLEEALAGVEARR